jgi:hypothetical protein
VIVGADSKTTNRTDALSDRDGGPTVVGELAVVWGLGGEKYFGGVFDEDKGKGIPAGNLIVRDGRQATRQELPKGAGDAGSPVAVIHGAGGDLWAGGAPRQIWHRNGATWEALATGDFAGPVTGIFVRAPGDVWIAGDTGAVLHRRP